MRTLTCNFSVSPGTYVIQVGYTNGITTLSDTKSVTIAPPLLITSLGGSSQQLVVWDSAPSLTYQVLATTNLSQPFQPISTVIPSQGLSTTFFDNAPAPQKYYEVQVITNSVGN